MGDYDRRNINSVKRATLSLVNDAGGMQAVQLNGYFGEVYQDVPRLQNYGFNSIPLPASGNSAAECVVVHPGMVASRAVALCLDDRRYRPLGGHGGDVSVYSYLDTPTASNATASHRIALDTASGRQIILRAANGNSATAVLTDQGTLTLTTTGGATAVVSMAADGTISITNSSATVQITPSGAINITAAATVNVNASGAVNITGSAIAMTASGGSASMTGNFTVNGTITATGDIKAGSISLESHVHSGIQSGSSNTGLPH